MAHEHEPPRQRPDRQDARRRPRLHSPAAAAESAVQQVVALTGREFGSVIAIERFDDCWQVGVEVVETHRIPESADILASYEVELAPDGELRSYRRTRRYARGQLDRNPS